MKKDMLGNRVKAGDVLIEVGVDYGFDGEKDTFGVTVWEMPKRYDGGGISYRIGKIKNKFYYARLEQSIKIDTSAMPEGFIFSFYNGMYEFDSYVNTTDVLEVINNSNWKTFEILSEKVERYNKLDKLKITSIEDIKENIDLFINNQTSREKGQLCHQLLWNYLCTKKWFTDGIGTKYNENYYLLLRCLKEDLENKIK